MGTSVVDTPGKKKLSGTAKGYLILFGLVVLSCQIPGTAVENSDSISLCGVYQSGKAVKPA